MDATDSRRQDADAARCERIGPALVEWHARQGRHDLPWQRDRTPYRVWVSEIMLQQTQVATVIPYYERFMARFPDVRALADASMDDVLHLWTGLGYYARARNLHRAAALIRDEFGGEFPHRFEDVASLPGIGRSTAGAILALSRGERWAILDGNVKRVLSRYFGIEGNAADPAVARKLWQRAEACTPAREAAIYTQAIMDLGAAVCVRRRPLCMLCPLAGECVARIEGRQHEIPAPKAPRARKSKRVYMLVGLTPDRRVLLQRRPDRGVWGGLWCPPEFGSLDAAREFASMRLRGADTELETLGEIRHAFTHFDLSITPLLMRCEGPGAIMDDAHSVWYNAHNPVRLGMPAPVKALLERVLDPAWSFESVANRSMYRPEA